jgi:hypothetical protein
MVTVQTMNPITKQFPKEVLTELLSDEEAEFEGLAMSRVEEKHLRRGRWETTYRYVFKHGILFYRFDYLVGSTEMQEQPALYEYRDMVPCFEVELKEKVIHSFELKLV